MGVADDIIYLHLRGVAEQRHDSVNLLLIAVLSSFLVLLLLIDLVLELLVLNFDIASNKG